MTEIVNLIVGLLLGGGGGALLLWFLGRRQARKAPPSETAADVVEVEVEHDRKVQEIDAEREELAKVKPADLNGAADAFNDAMGL